MRDGRGLAKETRQRVPMAWKVSSEEPFVVSIRAEPRIRARTSETGGGRREAPDADVWDGWIGAGTGGGRADQNRPFRPMVKMWASG